MRLPSTFTTLALTLAFTGLVRPAKAADLGVRLPKSGGLGGLGVTVDPSARVLRYAPCAADPCSVGASDPSVAIPPSDRPLDASSVVAEDVLLGNERHVAHVKVRLDSDDAPDAPAWEAWIAPGVAPLFVGVTGWSHGEPGERSGTEARLLSEGDHRVLVLGEVREDLHLCGEDATLLDPRGLDPKTFLFHGATLQRLSAARRDAAVAVDATPHHAAAEPSLARLLGAKGASSANDTATAITDGDLTTTWSEARPGRGQGEFVAMQTPYDVPLQRFAITVAPTKPKPEGAAPETFYLVTNTRAYEVTMPEDAWSHPGEAYDVALPEPVQTSCVALVLADVFTRGKAHPEVTVTELVAYTPFDHAGASLADVTAALRAGDPRAEAAAIVLEQAGPPGMKALLTAYPSLDATGRALAINVAASTSCTTSAPLLAKALADGDEVVREKARAKLEQPACGKLALPELLLALQSKAGRSAVAPLVALFGRERAVQPLVDVLGEGTSDERRTVRSALGLAARDLSPADLGALLARGEARGAEVRLDLLRTFAPRLPEAPAAADALIAQTAPADAPLATRYLLVDILAPLAAAHDASAQAKLRSAAEKDPASEVRAHALEFLASTEAGDDVAKAGLLDPEPRVREATLRALTAVPRGSTTSTELSLLARDPWTFVRVSAAEALAAAPARGDIDAALANATSQLATRVREQATLALGAHHATAYRGTVREHLADVKEELPVRLAAARAAGELCDHDAVEDLARLAVTGGSSPDPSAVALGLVATTALGEIHPKDLGDRLKGLGAKGVRPDARAAGNLALKTPGHCPLP